MSYRDIMDRMKENPTDGSEFIDDSLSEVEKEEIKKKLKEDAVLIGHTKCDYCNRNIIGVWDKHVNNQYWPFLGVQSKRANSYKYSYIMNLIKEHYVRNNKDWKENNLLNNHARCHSSISSNPKRWSDASIRILCNDCFQKTYNRIKVKGTGNDKGIDYALSVLTERGETIESVMKDLNITGIVLGKGGIVDYD